MQVSPPPPHTCCCQLRFARVIILTSPPSLPSTSLSAFSACLGEGPGALRVHVTAPDSAGAPSECQIPLGGLCEHRILDGTWDVRDSDGDSIGFASVSLYAFRLGPARRGEPVAGVVPDDGEGRGSIGHGIVGLRQCDA